MNSTIDLSQFSRPKSPKTKAEFLNCGVFPMVLVSGNDLNMHTNTRTQ